MLSLVEITTFKLERKSCNGFFENKFSTNESTQIYNKSCDLLLGLYLQIPTENHHYDNAQVQYDGMKPDVLSIVYDRNQVLVLGTETKVQFRYRYWS